MDIAVIYAFEQIHVLKVIFNLVLGVNKGVYEVERLGKSFGGTENHSVILIGHSQLPHGLSLGADAVLKCFDAGLIIFLGNAVIAPVFFVILPFSLFLEQRGIEDPFNENIIERSIG